MQFNMKSYHIPELYHISASNLLARAPSTLGDIPVNELLRRLDCATFAMQAVLRVYLELLRV